MKSTTWTAVLMTAATAFGFGLSSRPSFQNRGLAVLLLEAGLASGYAVPPVVHVVREKLDARNHQKDNTNIANDGQNGFNPGRGRHHGPPNGGGMSGHMPPFNSSGCGQDPHGNGTNPGHHGPHHPPMPPQGHHHRPHHHGGMNGTCDGGAGAGGNATETATATLPDPGAPTETATGDPEITATATDAPTATATDDPTITLEPTDGATATATADPTVTDPSVTADPSATAGASLEPTELTASASV